MTSRMASLGRRRRLAAAVVTVVTLVAIPVFGARTEAQQVAKARPPDGAALYLAYCASCHGRTGRGDGPVAEYLKIPPADLTKISSRANGVFPAHEVGRIIDGRQIVRAHGDAAMPVWGDAFRRVVAGIDATEVRARIEALVKYLEAMQPRQASRIGHTPEVARSQVERAADVSDSTSVCGRDASMRCHESDPMPAATCWRTTDSSASEGSRRL